MGVVLAAGALVVGAVAEAAPNRGQARQATPTAAPASGSLAWPSVPAQPATTLQHDFDAAAAEFHVPAPVLLAVSYEETQWESHGGRPSVTGNYNVMGLTEVNRGNLTAQGGSGIRGSADETASHTASARALAELHRVDTASPALHTLQTAAALAGVSAKRLRTDMRQSVRGGAALLASYESRVQATPGALPADAAQWWPAVVAYAQAETPEAGRQFAARVYALIQGGASRLTDDNQQVTLAASPSVRPPQLAGALASLASPAGNTECPSGLACTFTPAAYQRDTTQDTTKGATRDAAEDGGYGDYAKADRPTDGDGVSSLVLHETEGSRDGALAFLQDPTSYASVHYLIGRDGSVTQLVPTQDVAWHAGNTSVDAHSIGIAHEGYALRTGSWYTEAEYESSAALIRYLAARFSVPLDREHLLGGDDVPTQAPAAAEAPEPYWDWSHLLDLVGAPLTGLRTQPVVGATVTVAPPYDRTTQPQLTGCGATGQACPSHPANFVYLRELPSADAPLLGGGTTEASNTTAKAVYGQTFVVAGLSGDWVGVWYGGREAWFEDPSWRDTLVPDPASGAALTLVAPIGDQPIPVYGRAYPESSAYPASLSALASSPAQQLTPLADTITPDQAYLAGAQLSGDFYAASYGCAGPAGCTVVIGSTQYYPIRFDHRLAYVRASDVQLITPAPLPSPSASSSSH
ncbi:hypothetical protein ABH931_003820 [Streptacidiphilus sp. MAP12-33]|uniref:N-acetylmuramoyl-L-alanine amidase n=1 Tax=Streptacidiphilus sp. MAP12-33 TaxID=3156266 RepID=UPI0035169F48